MIGLISQAYAQPINSYSVKRFVYTSIIDTENYKEYKIYDTENETTECVRETKLDDGKIIFESISGNTITKFTTDGETVRIEKNGKLLETINIATAAKDFVITPTDNGLAIRTYTYGNWNYPVISNDLYISNVGAFASFLATIFGFRTASNLIDLATELVIDNTTNIWYTIYRYNRYIRTD